MNSLQPNVKALLDVLAESIAVAILEESVNYERTQTTAIFKQQQSA